MIITALLTCTYLTFAIPISLIDLKERRIPNVLLIICSAICIALILLLKRDYLPEAILTAVSCFALLLFTRSRTKGLGYGDVKFAAITGLVCGFPWAYFALAFAALSGLVIAIGLLHKHKITNRTKIPFAPFMTFGTFIIAIGLLMM
jgi:leader peptidase (prepilin peptidase) / N-methyltransferase